MRKLKSYEKRLFFGTGSIIIITGALAVVLFYLFFNFGFLIQLIIIVIFGIIAVISELLLLSHVDNLKSIETKARFIELGLIPEEENVEEELRREKQAVLSKIEKQNIKQMTILQNLRQFLKLEIAELNELKLEVEELFRELLFFIQQGRIKKAQKEFIDKSKNIRARVKELEQEFYSRLDKHFPPDSYQSKKINTFVISYREEWKRALSSFEKTFDEIQEKFRQKTNLQQYIEDVFRFELDNNRAFTENDILKVSIPQKTIKEILKMINKPVKINLNEISKEKKKALASLGKKVISHYTILEQKPTLPDIYVNLGISLTDAKEVLSYLKAIGMIDKIQYHIV